jgi:predicted homoserine dehydrogenase-like protein
MDLAWQCEGQLEELEAKLKEEPIDVFVEACGNIPVAAEAALMAIECHAHVILTDALKPTNTESS